MSDHPGMYLPTPPQIELHIENTSSTPQTRIHSIVVQPDTLELTMTVGVRAPPHRRFLPGVHKCIPLAASIGGDVPSAYGAPLTFSGRVERRSPAAPGPETG